MKENKQPTTAYKKIVFLYYSLYLNHKIVFGIFRYGFMKCTFPKHTHISKQVFISRYVPVYV